MKNKCTEKYPNTENQQHAKWMVFHRGGDKRCLHRKAISTPATPARIWITEMKTLTIQPVRKIKCSITQI